MAELDIAELDTIDDDDIEMLLQEYGRTPDEELIAGTILEELETLSRDDEMSNEDDSNSKLEDVAEIPSDDEGITLLEEFVFSFAVGESPHAMKTTAALTSTIF